MQAVKLFHNKPLYLGGDGNPTHFTPSLIVLIIKTIRIMEKKSPQKL